MEAAVFERPGLEFLKLIDVEEPKITDHDVLIRLKVAGVNPIDYRAVSGGVEVKPLPHIPEAELSGVVERIGNHVTNIKEGDRVIVYSRVFDGTCDLCLNQSEMLCRNGGIIGVVTNGGFAEYISVPERNVFKIPDEMDWDLAASLSISILTAFHALKEASLKVNDWLIVFGASGNTGMMALQFGKKIGASVIGVSKQHWITNFGADYVIGDYDKVVERVDEITEGRMADVVLNSLGVKTWDSSFASVGVNGRLVTFGSLTGADVKLNIQSLYYKQIKLIGATGGNRKELQEILTTFSAKDLKVKVWKRFSIQDARHYLIKVESEEFC